ncbi:MAG: tRNA (adenosine(37)-N6)-dimethylallyltransferase MiaA [bacterium]|nr:tRNA (adenosine(37)-N6)-dimethylallyltransferase MiaA [bacterium]
MIHNSQKRTKLVAILGPTSAGKTFLSLKLAKKFNGEIISADSRQVYKDLDIGSAKISKQEQSLVPHHLLDVISPKKRYSVAQYQQNAKSAAAQITSRGKLPFLVGGTAFYIYAVIDNLTIPKVKPNPKLRKQLEKKTAEELFRMLKKLDPERAKNIDVKNKRRLIRAIEIIKSTGLPVPSQHFFPLLQKQESILGKILDQVEEESDHGVLILGLNPKDNKARIAKNVKTRFKKGLLTEVQNLIIKGVSLKRLNEIGLTYKLVAEYLHVHKNARSRKNEYKELIDKVIKAEQQYARRQMTWFKRDSRIKWITTQKQAEKYITPFLRRQESK